MSVPVSNGGFPEPLSGEPQRLVSSRHRACGGSTRVRLPGALPARVVRRVVCERCEASYETEAVEDLGVVRAPAPAPTSHSRAWRWGSAALAALAVVGALVLINDGSETPEPASPGEADPEPPQAAGGAPGEQQGEGSEARFLAQPGFSLALPPGWEQVEPEGGAAFAARSDDAAADATLWIERDPKLDFAEFEARTVKQLRSLSGSRPGVVERINAPTIDGTVVRLRADAPAESGVTAPYEVTLRATGPYRYYLATTVLPGASRQAAEGADLIHGSFVPEAGGGGEIDTSAAPGSDARQESELP